MAEEFANYPKTIGELRPSDSAADWSPRDLLINLLREIDSGEANIKGVFMIVVAEDADGSKSPEFAAAGIPDAIQTMGLLELAKFSIMDNAGQ